MKKILFTVFLILCACSVTLAQVTIDISSEYNIQGGRIKNDELPTYYAEDGIVKFSFTGTDSWGYPESLVLNKTETTVKDSTQILEAKHIARGRIFEKNTDSTIPLSGTIKYIYHKLNAEERDSLKTEAAAAIAQNSQTLLRVAVKPYFKLYPTENMWTFIELDTVTGALWQVQYTVDKGEQYRFKTSLDLSDKRRRTYYPDTEEPGRFELYKTQNMYNFILLDTLEGGVWQVQWSTERNERMVVPILGI